MKTYSVYESALMRRLLKLVKESRSIDELTLEALFITELMPLIAFIEDVETEGGEMSTQARGLLRHHINCDEK